MRAVRRHVGLALAGVGLALFGAPARLYGVQRALDEGSFAILRDGHVVGREDFTIRQGAVGGASNGFIITTAAYYPAERPLRALSAVIQIHPDSQVASARFDATNGARQVSLIEFGQRRVTVRMGAPGRESTREHPSGGMQQLHHDSVFGYYAILPQKTGPVALISAQDGGRRSGTMQVHGVERTAIAGTQRTVRRVTIESDGGTLTLWFDTEGRLVKMNVPSLELTVERRAFARD